MYIFSCQKNQSQLVGGKKKHSSMGPKANQQPLMYRKLWVWFSLAHGVIYLWWYLYLCTLNLTERITYSVFTLKFISIHRRVPQVGSSHESFLLHLSDCIDFNFILQQIAKPAASWDDRKPRISWRGDGQFFTASAIHPLTGICFSTSFLFLILLPSSLSSPAKYHTLLSRALYNFDFTNYGSFWALCLQSCQLILFTILFSVQMYVP